MATGSWQLSAGGRTLSMIENKLLLITEEFKAKTTGKRIFAQRCTHLFCYFLRYFTGEEFCHLTQIKKHYHKVKLLTQPHAGREEELFKIIIFAYQILVYDAAQEVYKIFLEKILNDNQSPQFFLI